MQKLEEAKKKLSGRSWEGKRGGSSRGSIKWKAGREGTGTEKKRCCMQKNWRRPKRSKAADVVNERGAAAAEGAA
jgi:hypothetical protein